MQKAFVELNRVPTLVRTWGRWIESSGTPNEDIIVLIPGNPGLTGYYDYFLERLHNKLGYTVWSVGHAGHEEPKGKVLKVPTLKGNEELYDVQGQVNHKIDFFNKYVPEGSKVHLIGHSVGAHVILQLLKIPEINAKIADAYLLFPAIERMSETPNAWWFTPTMNYFYMIAVLLSYIFFYLPGFIQHFFIYIYCIITKMNERFIPTTCHLIRPGILSKVFFMAFDEMYKIKNLDLKVINDNKDKVRLYYAVEDGWAPASYCRQLIKDVPGVKAEICSRNFDHAYILRHSEASAEMVSDWISAKA